MDVNELPSGREKSIHIIMRAIEENLKQLVFPENVKPMSINVVIGYPESRVTFTVDLKGK